MTLEEINELVNEIQQLLGSESDVSEEELMDLAGRHEDFVVETTKWLKAVDALLQKGLRSEAIELAEREPNLNEVVVALEFPELDAWNELLLKHEMQPIQGLPEGIAADLNDAYGVSAPVERLLQKHRTAALARAPLSQRLILLRRLAVADKENPTWPQDIKEFEKHRMTEVRNDLDQAIRDRDLQQLASIDNELQSQDWSMTVPVELRRKASDAHSKLRKESGKAEMEGLAYQLSDTFAAFDLNAAKPLFNRFNALNQIVGLPSADQLMDIAGPALDWVRSELLKEDQERYFQQTIVALESSIDGDAPAAELERLFYEATRNDHVLPERLQLRLNDRLQTLKVMAIRRRRLMISVSVAAAVLLLAVTGFAIHNVRLRNTITKHETQLATLFAEAEATGLTNPLQEYFDLLATEPASVSQSAEILGLRQQYESLRLKEDGRRKQLDELIAQATTASETAEVPSKFNAILETLKSAEAVALNDGERTRVLKAEVIVREKQTAVQKATDEAFQIKWREVTDRVAALPDDDVAPYDKIQSEITAIADNPEVSNGLLESVRAVQSKLRAERLEVSRGIEIARGLQSVTNSIGSAEPYMAELGKYIQQFAGTARATDFSKVIESERDLLIGALKWNSIRKKLLAVDFKRITGAEAASLVEEYSEFYRTSGPFAGDMGLNDRLLMLQAAGKRKPAADGIKLIFDGKAISNSFMIETSDGRERYYADAPPVVDKGLTFDSYTTPSGDQTMNRRLGNSLVPDAEGKSREAWQSPQTRLANSLIQHISTAETEDFESLIRVTTERILQDEPKLDPILRLLLVERTLEYGSDGSHFVSAKAKPVLAAFAEAGIPRLTNWVNYQDAQNRKLRDLATEFLQKQSAAILDCVKEAEANRDGASRLTIGPEVRWVGWLGKDEKNPTRWLIRMKPDTSIDKDGDIVVFGRRTPTEKPQQLKVATATAAGVITVDDRIEATLPLEGRAAFLVSPEQ